MLTGCETMGFLLKKITNLLRDTLNILKREKKELSHEKIKL